MKKQIAQLPPNAIDLEEIIIGSILSNSDAFIFVADILTSKHFYSSSNSLIYASFERLASEGHPIDLMTVINELKKSRDYEKVGGAHALTGMADRVVSSVNIEHHARIILQKHMQRKMMQLCRKTERDCADETVDIFDIIQLYEEARDELINQVVTSRESTNFDVSVRAMKRIAESIGNSEKDVSGVPTGIDSVNKTTGGWQPGNLYILAARPAMGKTALMLTFLINAAKNGYPVSVFSLEMGEISLYDRALAREARVNIEKIIKTKVNHEDYQVLQEANRQIRDLPIYWDDKAETSITELSAKAKRLKRMYDIKMIVVDYLQLMSGNRSGNREQEISSISRGLKVLAKDLNIPIIALSQLSRAVESRPGNNKRPMLSDLRESGSIEQDADAVMFLYRPEYYGIEETELGDSTVGLAELIFAKNRNGSTDNVELLFEGKYMNFADFRQDDFSQFKHDFDNSSMTSFANNNPNDYF